MFWPGLLLTLALSMDGFVVGLHYGMRRIAIPWRSLAIMALCTAFGMAVSMIFGDAAAGLVSPESAQAFGGALFVFLGLWQLFQAWTEYLKAGAVSANPGVQPLLRVRIRPLGIIVHILMDPMQADADFSGNIDLKEATLLGVALGLDTLAAGFAAAMLGFGPLLIAAVTAGLLSLVWGGVATGRRLEGTLLGRKGIFVPGALLVLMGILHI